MQTNKIFIGTIRKCTGFYTSTLANNNLSLKDNTKLFFNKPNIPLESIGNIYIENVTLVEIKPGTFIDAKSIQNSFHYYFQILNIWSKVYEYQGSLVMKRQANNIGDLFIDDKSIKPSPIGQNKKHISVRQLKKCLNKC